MWDSFHHMNGYGWGMGGFGVLLMVVVWVGVIVGAVFLIRLAVGNRSAGPESRSALEILEERYARGEIDREEFEQKRTDLRREQD